MSSNQHDRTRYNLDPNPRRPSYASVASGVAVMNPSRFSTLAGVRQAEADRQAQRELRREASRTSLRSMEMDGGGQGLGQSGGNGNGGNRGGWKSWMADGTGSMGCMLHDEHLPFFTPSYLKTSRHVERLRLAWEEHVQELRDSIANLPPPSAPRPTLSARSSSTNLSKPHLPHQHQHQRLGVVKDVIERVSPPTTSEASAPNPHPLPTKWSDEDRQPGLEVLGAGAEIRFNGVTKGDHEAASVRADHPMPREVGLYYYEVTVLSRGKEGWIGIGFSGSRVSLNRLPGWETDSWAYHGDDGYSFACTASGKAYGPRYAAGDVVGCGINFRTGTAFFTRNGVYLNNAFTSLPTSTKLLYPSIGVRKPGEHLRANLGREPFVFDIDRMMAAERKSILAEISIADISGLRPPDDEDALVRGLVGQYLAHEGYVETARAFRADVQEQEMSMSNQAPGLDETNDDIHAVNRQKIRRAILDGDIDRALKYINSFYPHLLEKECNRDVHFRLQCRKFIEMMRRYTELSTASDGSTAKGSNGHANTAVDDEEDADEDVRAPTSTQMELDDQLHREAQPTHPLPPTDDVDMANSPLSSSKLHPTTTQSSKASAIQQSTLLAAALAYGQDLQRHYGADPRPFVKKTLSDIFAIMAYTHPQESVVGGVMSEGERVGLGEGVNGAILVSLGKPSSAALEKVCAQTEALLERVGSKTGGGSAFVGVRDFLGGE